MNSPISLSNKRPVVRGAEQSTPFSAQILSKTSRASKKLN